MRTLLALARSRLWRSRHDVLRQTMEANAANILDLMSNQALALQARIDASETMLLEQLVAQRSFLPLDLADPGRPAPVPIDPPSVEEAFRRMQAAAPLSWNSYLRCLDTGTESYQGLPPTSCSTEAHPQSLLFRAFLRPYLRGFVLDIGCGPQPVPSYLADYPPARITGIDPISKPEDHPFAFVPGVGEYLPFADASFDVLVSGTTLDHYYLLDQGLREAARVLVPGGHFVAWITEFAGAPAYDPYSRAAEPYDSEHMYHIDRAWFLPLMARSGFQPAEIIHFRLPFNYLFMSFVKR